MIFEKALRLLGPGQQRRVGRRGLSQRRLPAGSGVFTATRGGLMLEASVGGQKFSYTPFAKKKVSEGRTP
jgi:hypothetical protein